jgi:hypothetical protein
VVRSPGACARGLFPATKSGGEDDEGLQQ